MSKNTKMIRVTSRGMVTTSRGRVIAPIMFPYRETIERIWTMITTDRATVEEQLPDKSFVQLTAQNFDKDNYTKVEDKIPTSSNASARKQDTFVNTDNMKEKSEDVVNETSSPESIEKESVDTTNDTDEQRTIMVGGEKRVDPRFNKKNKKNRNNNTPNNDSIAVEPEVVQ